MKILTITDRYTLEDIPNTTIVNAVIRVGHLFWKRDLTVRMYVGHDGWTDIIEVGTGKRIHPNNAGAWVFTDEELTRSKDN